MEIIPSGIISSISNSLCSYCLEHLKHHQQYEYCATFIIVTLSVIRYSEHHLLLVWVVTMVMIECHSSEIHQENFISSIVMVTVINIITIRLSR